MADKTVAQKARVKPDATVAVLGEGESAVIDSMGLPDSVTFVDPALATILFVFVRGRSELDSKLSEALEVLAPEAALWVFFRKGSKAAGLDMGRDEVFSAAQALGLGPLGLLSVDETWSVFRLRRIA